jgi:uncharacterized protein
MSKRDGFEPGVPCWIDTWQPDADAAVAFYTALFGWDAAEASIEGAPMRHMMMSKDGREVAGIGWRPAGEGPGLPTAWGTYVQVADLDATLAAAAEAGGTLVMGPIDSLDGGRIAMIADPGGAVLGVWQLGEHGGARVVNEAGAWAMSVLTSDDVDGAREFYPAVFGWTWDAFPLGDQEGTLWRMPGYVGGEPSQPVPRDVVAVMAPAQGRPATWVVGFWVEDADAIAAAAPGLGGRVVAGPFDSGISRDAVIADPAGAVFSVTTVPPVARDAAATPAESDQR